MEEIELIGFGYIVFDNTVLFLLAFWELITFESLSLWVSVTFGVIFGLILSILFFKPWKDLSVNIGVGVFFTLMLFVFTGEHGTSSYIEHYKELKDKEYRRYIEVEKWKKNNPNIFLRDTKEGREWLKTDESVAKEISQYRNVIENKLSNQFLFLFFSVITFIFSIPQLRAFLDKISLEAKQKKEQKKNRIESERIRAENERRAREQRLLIEEQQQIKTEKETVLKERTIQDNSSSEINELIERAKRSQR